MEQVKTVMRIPKKIPLWVYPLLVTLLLFPPTESYQLTSDSWSYMAQGVNIVTGRGYTDVDGTPVTFRGPIFPMWFALLFELFGVSVATAFVATRLFYVTHVMLAYVLGAKLFGSLAGLFASLLILSSVSLSEWATLMNIDHVFSTFVLFNFLVMLWSFEGNRIWRFAVSGFLLGLTYLLKELILIWMPLPVLLLIGKSNFRVKRNFYGVVLLYLAFSLTVIPWLLYVKRHAADTGILGGAGGPGALKTLIGIVSTGEVGRIPQGIIGYYTNIVAPNFGLAPLFVLSWIAVFVLAFRGRSSQFFCGMAALCFLPLMFFQGMEGWRPHHGMVFFVLSYLVLASGLCLLITYVRRSWGLKKSAVRIVTVCLLLGILGLQMSLERWLWFDYAKGNNVVGFLNQGQASIEVNQWGEARQVAKWLRDGVEPGSVILTDFSYRAALHFYSMGEYFFQETPLLCSPYYTRKLFQGCSLPSDASSAGKRQKVLFLWPDGGKEFLSSTSQSALVAITEEQLFSSINRHHIRYVIVPKRTGFQSLYFERHPGVKKVADFDRGKLKIYRVDDPTPVDFPAHVEWRLPKYLKSLKREEPDEYVSLGREYLSQTLGLSHDEVDKIEKWQFPTVGLRWVYDVGKGGECTLGWNILEQREGLMYQGHLFFGEEPADTLTGMSARIYDAPTDGRLIWSQAFEGTSVTNGSFRLDLATADPTLLMPRLKGAPLFLEVSTDGCPPIRPRHVLTKELDSQDPWLFVKVGNHYLTQERMAEASTAYEKAVDIGGYTSESRLRLARRYMMAAKKAEVHNAHDDAAVAYRQAISIFLRDLQRSTGNSFKVYDLGQAHEVLGDIGTAVKVYEKAIEINPFLAEAFRSLGSIYVRNGDRDKAIELYRKAALMNPKSAWPHLELGRLYLDPSTEPPDLDDYL